MKETVKKYQYTHRDLGEIDNKKHVTNSILGHLLSFRPFTISLHETVVMRSRTEIGSCIS